MPLRRHSSLTSHVELKDSQVRLLVTQPRRGLHCDARLALAAASPYDRGPIYTTHSNWGLILLCGLVVEQCLMIDQSRVQSDPSNVFTGPDY